MSLNIQTDNVRSVLLADGWHEVHGESFDLDAYEFSWEDQTMHAGGNSGICSTGFAFRDADMQHFAGPLTSIIAVRYQQ